MWAEPASDELPALALGEAPAAKGARVLLVEDNPDNQAIITHLLTQAGVR